MFLVSNNIFPLNLGIESTNISHCILGWLEKLFRGRKLCGVYILCVSVLFLSRIKRDLSSQVEFLKISSV